MTEDYDYQSDLEIKMGNINIGVPPGKINIDIGVATVLKSAGIDFKVNGNQFCFKYKNQEETEWKCVSIADGTTVIDSSIDSDGNIVLEFDDQRTLILATPKDIYWNSTNW